MAETQVSRLSSPWQVTGFDVTNLLIGVAFGSRPDATTVTHRSRSVMIPINWRDLRSSTTGTDPMLWSRRILAAFSAVSLGVQQIGSGVITSLTFMGDFLINPLKVCLGDSDGLFLPRDTCSSFMSQFIAIVWYIFQGKTDT